MRAAMTGIPIREGKGNPALGQEHIYQAYAVRGPSGHQRFRRPYLASGSVLADESSMNTPLASTHAWLSVTGFAEGTLLPQFQFRAHEQGCHGEADAMMHAVLSVLRLSQVRVHALALENGSELAAHELI